METSTGPSFAAERGGLATLFVAVAMGAALAASAGATQLHVATDGNDTNPGSRAAPLRTIQHAADLAQPGDEIVVHGGTYRERINPPRGGASDAERIVYRSAAGERVEIKGSEVVKNWERVKGDVWKVTLSNSFFGDFNPYSDEIHGDWFNPLGRKRHTGAVYLNGDWLAEAAALEDVLASARADPLWFGRVDHQNTTIWARFNGVDPNEQRVEINVRQTVFYPDKPGRNFITVRGFIMRDAATPWAPPTAEQIGLVGTHWSRGWIIEDNVISHSVCSGISLGKYGDRWDNTSANTAEGYVRTIERALQNGWDKQTVGHHVVRRNTISHCEQAGIVGSLGAVFSTISDNTIHDIHVRKLFSGAEMAGIKLHAAIDVRISGNHIYRTCRGLWLDWMAQGTRVTGNLFHDNQPEDVFVEVNHGPFLFDNNIFLSPVSLLDWSEGGAYAHNLMAGRVVARAELNRATPFHPAHSTRVAGLKNIAGGDDRFFNNVFIGDSGLTGYDQASQPVVMGGNVFLKSAAPSRHEADPARYPGFDLDPRLVKKPDGLYLELTYDRSWSAAPARQPVTSGRLGKASVPGLGYEQPDGKPIRIDTDYLGQKRSDTNPTPGPFERPGVGRVTVKVW
jgi:alpha-L-arabinofuranosidase